jgi:mono/diheme cytochrome c family protein
MKKYIFIACSPLFASCGSESNVQDNRATESKPAVSAGKQVFINNCIQCHNLKTDKIGPKLEGSFANWGNDTLRFRAFIRNSKAAIESGDPRAVEVAKQWNNTLMTEMPHLTDNDINDILDYINKGIE